MIRFLSFLWGFVGLLCVAGGLQARGPESPQVLTSLVYETKSDTWLKLRIREISDLPANEKCLIPAGTKLRVAGRPRHVFNDHFHVTIFELSEGVCEGFEDGYVYGPHFSIRLGDASLTVYQDTFLKLRVREAGSLPQNEKCFVPKGTELILDGAPELFVGNHYHLKLAGIVGPEGATTGCEHFPGGYVYGPHIGMLVAPNGYVQRVIKSTILKKRLVDAGALSADEKCTLPAEMALIVAKPLTHAGNNHVLADIRSYHRCTFSSGYIYAPHLGIDFFKPLGNTANAVGAGFGARFAQYAKTNYDQIAGAIGTSENAGAAFATMALRSFGVDIPYLEWPPAMAEMMVTMGWTKMTNAAALTPGDLVFTRGLQGEWDGLANHVFIFNGYAGGTAAAYVIDSQGNSHVRSLNDPSKYSPFWFAFRKP